MKCKYSSFHKRLSACDCDGADIIVFYSKYVSLTKSTMTLLTNLVKSKNRFFTAQITNTIKQSGSSDCGVFAAAYASSLAFGHNPCAFVYDQCRMREHLLRCLQQKKMEPFEFSIHKNAENRHSMCSVCKCILLLQMPRQRECNGVL